MSLFRVAFFAGAVVLLLPTDERRQTELSNSAKSGIESAATFCERNPSSCAAGRELWATFLRKAEFGVELAARLARSALARSSAAPVEPPLRPERGNAPGPGTLAPADLRPEWRRPPRSGA